MPYSSHITPGCCHHFGQDHQREPSLFPLCHVRHYASLLPFFELTLSMCDHQPAWHIHCSLSDDCLRLDTTNIPLKKLSSSSHPSPTSCSSCDHQVMWMDTLQLHSPIAPFTMSQLAPNPQFLSENTLAFCECQCLCAIQCHFLSNHRLHRGICLPLLRVLCMYSWFPKFPDWFPKAYIDSPPPVLIPQAVYWFPSQLF